LQLLEHMRAESFIRAGMEVIVDEARTAEDVVPLYERRATASDGRLGREVVRDQL
jgi:hypothetical protein